MAFRRDPILFRVCALTDALGAPITLPAPPAGLTFQQWWDPELARGWFRYAQDLVDRMPSIDGADLPLQLTYMNNIGRSLMNGYNALNIPWNTDADARRLFRQYMSGPPQPPTISLLTTEFGKRANYGGSGWFQPNQKWPRASNGSIPRVAADHFYRYFGNREEASNHPLNIVLPFMPEIARLGDGGGEVPEPGIFDDPEAFRQSALPGSINWANAWPAQTSISYLSLGQCRDIRTGGACTGTWYDFRFDEPSAFGFLNPQVSLDVAPALVWFWPWLSEWVRSAVARTPEEIVGCARSYVIYRNNQQIESFRSVDAFLREVSSAPGSLLEQIRSSDSVGADIFATSALALGAAFGTVTFGISTLVGGAAAAVSKVMQSAGAFDQGIRERGRDDLGRYKPFFERAWLAGNPTDAGDNPGAILRVPAVPGGLAPMPPPPTPGSHSSYDDLLVANTPEAQIELDAVNHLAGIVPGYGVTPTGFNWAIPVTLAIGAVLVYAGYTLFFSQPKG